MSRKCIISAAVMFVMSWALSFVVHGLLLGGDYAVTPGMRPPAEAQRIIGYLILAQASRPSPGSTTRARRTGPGSCRASDSGWQSRRSPRSRPT